MCTLKMTLFVLLASFLLACQTRPIQQPGPTNATAGTVDNVIADAKPFPEPELDGAQQLSKGLLYDYLVAEISAKAGHFSLALEHYLRAAVKAKDPYAAERATRIALHMQDFAAAEQAVGHWIQFAPNAPFARQLAGIVFLQQDDLAQAQQAFEALLSIVAAEKKDAWLAIADILNHTQNADAAYRLMRLLVNQHADQATAQYALAVIEVAQQQYTQAEQSLHKAIELEPTWGLAHNLLVRVMLAQNQQDAAVQYLQKTLQALPDAHLLRRTYAQQLVDMQRFPEALTAFRLLHKAWPEDKDNAYVLAILESQQKNWPQARMLWQQLRDEAKFYANASYFLAQVEEFTDHKDLAISLYANVTQGEHLIDAAIRQASLLAGQGRIVEMRARLLAVREQQPKQALASYVAEAQILQEHVTADEVLPVYREALEAYPNNTELLYNRGLYYAEIERYEAMETDFRTVVELDASYADAWNALGYTLADRRVRLDEAWDYIQHAFQLQPESPAILDSLGWIHYRMGNLDDAEKYLHAALGEMQDEEIAAHLGEVLWVQGKQEEARKVWNEILHITPDSKVILPVMQRLGVN